MLGLIVGEVAGRERNSGNEKEELSEAEDEGEAVCVSGSSLSGFCGSVNPFRAAVKCRAEASCDFGLDFRFREESALFCSEEDEELELEVVLELVLEDKIVLVLVVVVLDEEEEG